MFKTKEMKVLDKPLSNLQIEILKLYSFDLKEEQLLEVKDLLAKYFADKASDAMDKLWEKNNWSEQTMNEWLSEKEA